MARTAITLSGTSPTGTAAPTGDIADPTFGNSAVNPDGRTALLITNTGVVTRTLLVRVAVTVDGLAVTPRSVSIPAGVTLLAGMYDPTVYGTTLQLDPDSTDLRIAAIRLGEQASAGVPFTLDGLVVVADLTFYGVSSDGPVLTVDTALTSSTLDGNVLVVTV